MEPLRAGKTCELILKFTNPTQHQTVITLLKMMYDEEDIVKEENSASDVIETSDEKLSSEEVNANIKYFRQKYLEKTGKIYLQLY